MTLKTLVRVLLVAAALLNALVLLVVMNFGDLVTAVIALIAGAFCLFGAATLSYLESK